MSLFLCCGWPHRFNPHASLNIRDKVVSRNQPVEILCAVDPDVTDQIVGFVILLSGDCEKGGGAF
jgi:hypothetical protein